MQSVYAECHKHHEDFFTVWKPGLLESVPNSDFLSLPQVGDRPGSYGLYERRAHTTPDGSIEKEYAAIIVEMTGRLRNEGFYLSTDGARGDPNFDESDRPAEFASCWLDPPADDGLERAVWRRGLRRLKALGTERGDQTSELVRPDPAPGNIPSPMLLQVSWTPPAGSDNLAVHPMALMPVFTSEEEHHPFQSLASVPFGRRVRVRFTLRSTGNILGARLLSMHLL